MEKPDTDLLTVTELKRFIKEILMENKMLKAENGELMQHNQEMMLLLKKTSVLNGLISICSNCKCICETNETQQHVWMVPEAFLEKYTGARFTHGLCPQCAQTLYPNLDATKKEVIKQQTTANCIM